MKDENFFTTQYQAAYNFLKQRNQHAQLTVYHHAFDNLMRLIDTVSQSNNNDTKEHLYHQLCEAQINVNKHNTAKNCFNMLRELMKNKCAPLLDNYIQEHYPQAPTPNAAV